jgi:hypothetical protein
MQDEKESGAVLSSAQRDRYSIAFPHHFEFPDVAFYFSFYVHYKMRFTQVGI